MNFPIDVIYRFWSFVDIKGPDDCWLWRKQGSKLYGNFTIGKQSISAHKMSYLIHKGEYDPNLNICHSCDNTRCVNPKHLEAKTQLENRRDAAARGRTAKGLDHGRSVLDHEQASEVRRLRSLGWTYQQLADKFKCGTTTIGRILSYESWH